MAFTQDEAVIATPIGRVAVRGDDHVLHAVTIGVDATPRRASAAAVRAAVTQLEAYFEGASTTFDLPLRPLATLRGEALRAGITNVPFGEAAGYGELARRLGSSARAIGQACARNPFPIVVPCHRVVGAGQRIGHYSGGAGVTTKRALLAHEARLTGKDLRWAD